MMHSSHSSSGSSGSSGSSHSSSGSSHSSRGSSGSNNARNVETLDALYANLQTRPFILAGTCVIEDYDIMSQVCEVMVELSAKYGFVYVFKSSFDKANRTSINSHRGPGLDAGLEVLSKIKTQFGVPIVTDIHESHQADAISEVADIIQIPAFLCRQTDLLVASAKTGAIVNIKKAQFLSGANMVNPVQKVVESGNSKVMLTERGTMMGYGDLVLDFRNLIDMGNMESLANIPLILDATHSVQKPSSLGDSSGGNREYVPYYANMAASIGIKGFFFETHPNPDVALSDGANMVPLGGMDTMLSTVFNTLQAQK